MEDLTSCRASCLPCTTCRVQLSHCLLLLAVISVPQIAMACDKFDVSGIVFHKSVEGTYVRKSRALNCRSLPVYQQKGDGLYYLFYAVKPTQLSGGWVIGDRRCADYEDSLIVSDSETDAKIQDVTTWRELPYGYWANANDWANANVQVQCSSSSGLSVAAVASLATCLILLAVFIVMLIVTVRRWRQRKKRRRQDLEALRTLPSISGRVRGREQLERDLPPTYQSIVQSDQAMTDSANLPPSYEEVTDNPSYVQIHSPLSTGGINNLAFDFDSSTGETCL